MMSKHNINIKDINITLSIIINFIIVNPFPIILYINNDKLFTLILL